MKSKKLWVATDNRYKSFVSKTLSKEEIKKSITYVKEKKYSMTYGELILHLSHHSYYHRGQIAMFLRQNNLAKAPTTDAEIFFRD